MRFFGTILFAGLTVLSGIAVYWLGCSIIRDWDGFGAGFFMILIWPFLFALGCGPFATMALLCLLREVGKR